jgi:hypothetical protein
VRGGLKVKSLQRAVTRWRPCLAKRTGKPAAMEESIAWPGSNNLLDLLLNLQNTDKKSANLKKSDKLPGWIL